MRIENSTISGNTVLADHWQGFYGYGVAAGGVLAYVPNDNGSISIDHSTIAFNRVMNAPSFAFEEIAGGVVGLNYTYNGNYHGANVGVRNTIIARNESNIGDPDVNGSFLSQGHNLLGVLSGGATGFVASDLRGTAAAPLDPRLLPLADNGGPTLTHALMRDSPAINAGDNSNAPPTDQRGRNRIVAGVIDIGAVESPGEPHPPGGAATIAPALPPAGPVGSSGPASRTEPGGVLQRAGPALLPGRGATAASAPAAAIARLHLGAARLTPPNDMAVRDAVFQDYAGPLDLPGP